MESNGKIKNAEVLAREFGVFVSVDDMAKDLENAKAAIAYRERCERALKRSALARNMEDHVREHPESAEFFTGKKGKELCRVRVSYNGRDYEWCGLVSDMSRTAPFWIQTEEYRRAL